MEVREPSTLRRQRLKVQVSPHGVVGEGDSSTSGEGRREAVVRASRDVRRKRMMMFIVS